MSVASPTKTKMVTALLLALSASGWLLPVSAYILPPSGESVAWNSSVSGQSLSVLWSRLQQRFSTVSADVRSLLADVPYVWLSGASSVDAKKVSYEVASRTSAPQNEFLDIENDPYQSYIKRLAAYGVLQSTIKYYPQNYFRTDDFVWLVQKLYFKTFGVALTDPVILQLSADNDLMTKRMLQQTMTALGLGTGMSIDGNPYDRLLRSEWAYYLVRMFDVPILEWVSSLPTLPDMFTDISWHPAAYAINTLASLGIVNTDAMKFYPDNYLRHYDFVVLFVQTYLHAQHQSLPTVSTSLFADVPAASSYLSQLTYAADRGFIDQLITSRQWQLYFAPDSFITKDEAYQIIAKTLHVELLYDREQALSQKISRAELVMLLVRSFELQPILEQDDSSLGEDELSVLTKLKTLISLL